jgi:hypothetical protein
MKENAVIKMPACEVKTEITDNIPDTVNTEDREDAPYVAQEEHGDDDSGGQETSDPDGSVDMIENHLPALRSGQPALFWGPERSRLPIQFTSFLAGLWHAKRPSF